jgi:UDP-N-acetylglucosamine--N-acetylmuramyl-(pentapeptide) pyrophosphoryl-undecaprenol N-acetylglucosamine transferase
MLAARAPVTMARARGSRASVSPGSSLARRSRASRAHSAIVVTSPKDASAVARARVPGRVTGRVTGRVSAACSAASSSAAASSDARAPLRVLFAAGGTGGHVFPAIAIADALVAASDARALPDDRVAEIHFAGTAHRQESRLVPAAGYPLHLVPAVSLARPIFSPRNLLLPFALAWAAVRAVALLLRLRPHVVVGTGGYVSLPVCLAAALLRVPLVVQEQNAHPGVANRVLAPACAAIFVAFAAAADALGKGRHPTRQPPKILGNPVRASLQAAVGADARRDARRRARAWFEDAAETDPETETETYDVASDDANRVLLVLGGSLGAAAVNRAMAAVAPLAFERYPRLWIVWQTGEREFESVRNAVPRHPRLAVLPFIREMDVAYASSDAAMARAGAVTCAELLATATPAVLVPSPNVAEDHQTANAREMERAGAATMISEAELPRGDGEGDEETIERLVRTVWEVVGDDARLRAMANAAATGDAPDAAEEIAREVARVARR